MSFFFKPKKKKPVSEAKRGINLKSSQYFELCYSKNGIKFYVCFMGLDESQAKLKSQLMKKQYEADKIIYVKKLDPNNLAKSLTWNKKGRK